MRIAAISDMHGNLNFSVPESDLLLIAGDICPAAHDPYLSIGMQRQWLDKKFREWLNKQPISHAIAVAGNHCWIFEYGKDEVPFFGEKEEFNPWLLVAVLAIACAAPLVML